MKYLYYPGCSLKSSGKAYEESLLAVFEKLEVPLTELPAWNCCGATAYMAIDERQALALAARNLALAEETNRGQPVDLVTPCNACYLVLLKARNYIRDFNEIARTITGALRESGLQYQGVVNVRHPLDVLVNDIGINKIAALATKPLKGLKVACYYGCQMVRPYATFDDQRNPTTMDKLLRALGAEVVEWPLKTKCCGGSLTGTVEEVGLRLSYILLREARRRQATVVVTACPLCQFNLECYQNRMRSAFADDIDMPVLYFTQLLGKALGVADQKLGLHRMFVPLQPAAAAT